MTGRSLVLTTAIGGGDGIARASALVARALGTPGAPADVDVVSLADPASAPWPAGIRVHGAGGRRTALLATALRLGLGHPLARIVCLHLHLAPLARLVAARRARLAVYLHGIEAWRPLRWRDRCALRRADVLIANSSCTARRFAAANPRLRERQVRVCHLAVADAQLSAPDRGSAGSFALIVGRMSARERYKGHDVLLDVWPRLVQDVPSARLVVVGDGDDRARLESRACTLGDRVSFAGRVSDAALERLYRQCAFLAMPSAQEGFGLVFLEAMRAGRPCIAGPGAPAELIEHGVTGLIVDPSDPEQVRGALAELFSDPARRAAMGRAGAARVARDFTEAEFRRRFRAVLGLEPPEP